jgi:hypothetical protein
MGRTKRAILFLLVAGAWAGRASAEPPAAGHLLRGLDRRYAAEVRPIFEHKCLDCHSGQTRYPWYYKIPGVRQLIDSDIREARGSLDMTDGFPFQGRGSPKEHLTEVRSVVEESSMPPFLYRVAHGAALTEEEKKIVLKWAADGIILLSIVEGK